MAQYQITVSGTFTGTLPTRGTHVEMLTDSIGNRHPVSVWGDLTPAQAVETEVRAAFRHIYGVDVTEVTVTEVQAEVDVPESTVVS